MKTKTPCRKKKWKDIQIIRVKLNPEQAVLACCSPADGRGVRATYQCYMGCGSPVTFISS